MDNKIDLGTKTEHKCPLCSDILTYYTQRYPKMICINCSNGNKGKILDSLGNEVTFVNIDIYGGFMSLHKIDDKIVEKKEHICWINNIKCSADEARFGGIVIQIL